MPSALWGPRLCPPGSAGENLCFKNPLDILVSQKTARFGSHHVLPGKSVQILSLTSPSLPPPPNNMPAQSVPSQRDHQATSSDISTHGARCLALSAQRGAGVSGELREARAAAPLKTRPLTSGILTLQKDRAEHRGQTGRAAGAWLCPDLRAGSHGPECPHRQREP